MMHDNVHLDDSNARIKRDSQCDAGMNTLSTRVSTNDRLENCRDL